MNLPIGWKTEGSLDGFESVKAVKSRRQEEVTGLFIARSEAGRPLIRVDWEPGAGDLGIFTGSLFEDGHAMATEQLFTQTLRSLVDWIEYKAAEKSL